MAKGVVYIGGSSGTVDSITVNGEEILGTAVSFNATIAQTAVDVAAQINTYTPRSGRKYMATPIANGVIISTVYNTGTNCNGYACTIGCTTLTGTNGTISGTAGTGVAGSNGLKYKMGTAGVLQNNGVWSGVIGVTGVAGYFRILGSVNDTGAASTSAIRVQGACGVSTGDYPMTTTTLTAGQTHTIDAFELDEPAA